MRVDSAHANLLAAFVAHQIRLAQDGHERAQAFLLPVRAGRVEQAELLARTSRRSSEQDTQRQSQRRSQMDGLQSVETCTAHV